MPRFLVAALALAAASAAHAGTTLVSFVNPANFSDAGTTTFDERANLDALGRYMQALGQQYLPADQVLKVEVLDVDLAGIVRPSRGDLSPIRVARGGADFPRFTLRWSLEDHGAIAGSGEEAISDLNYTRHFARWRYDRPLGDEKRLLERWFRERFAGLPPKG